jgi:hypothetical protein
VYGVDAIREKLANFETMTWGEILLDAKKQNHNVSVDDLVKEAQDRLTEIFPEQLDELTSLRLTGKGRVWRKVDEGLWICYGGMLNIGFVHCIGSRLN